MADDYTAGRFALGKSLLISLFMLPGCASFYLPGNRMESPEALGPGKRGQLDFAGIQGGKSLLAEPLPPKADPDTGELGDPELQTSMANFFMGFQLPVDEKTDLTLRISPYSPPLLGVRHQWLGETVSKAESGNFSASLSAAAGWTQGRVDGVDSISVLIFDSAVPFGYRAGKRHLISLSPSFRLAQVSSSIAELAGTATQLSASLGYQYEAESLVFRIEESLSSGKFQDASTGGWLTAASLSFRIEPSP